jgi:hypothetical protein
MRSHATTQNLVRVRRDIGGLAAVLRTVIVAVNVIAHRLPLPPGGHRLARLGRRSAVGIADHRACGDDHRGADAGAADLQASNARAGKVSGAGVLFVNVSIGGTLTAYAAPPVLMVASTWQWDSALMVSLFGWKAAVAVLINASVAAFALRRHCVPVSSGDRPGDLPVPTPVVLVHLALLAGVVVLAHHPVAFLGLFLLFLGFAQAYERHQSPLIIKEALLVGFFLAGLVVLGGLQGWWLEPIVSSLKPLALFFGSLGLTAITDNAALTYLGSLISGISTESQYMLVAGAVAGGGLTVIANAPNPAGVALLRRGFADESIGAGGLLLGALGPTAVAAAAFLLL